MEIRSDSQLVVKDIQGDYEGNHEHMLHYLVLVVHSLRRRQENGCFNWGGDHSSCKVNNTSVNLFSFNSFKSNAWKEWMT